MNPIRVIFAGGGGEQDARPLDETFARWLGKDSRVLYLPTALVDAQSMRQGVDWFASVYPPLGLRDFEAWTDLTGKTRRDLIRFDGIYIGGGNTFYLLDQIRKHRLDAPLLDFIRQGRPVYGGSAGAIILGKDITPSAHIDPDIVGLADRTGLDAAQGWSIWCHYSPGDESRIREYVRKTGIPSAAATERAGIIREGDKLYAAGYEPVVVFEGEAMRVVEPGEIVG